jgi:hypothetical protein
MESDPECNALWYTLGMAMEIRMDWHTGESTTPVPTKYGWGAPSLIALGQNDRNLLVLIDLEFPDEIHVRVSSPSTREGVSQGRGRAPSVASSVKEEMTRCSRGAWPMGATLTLKSDTLRGLSVGVGTRSVCVRLGRVSRAIWKIYAGGTEIEDTTLKTSSPW